VANVRAALGAYQNRFEHTVSNLNVAIENLSASKSAITDTDMTQEMTSFSRSQIISQAGTAMLAQPNQAPQGILKLLGQALKSAAGMLATCAAGDVTYDRACAVRGGSGGGTGVVAGQANTG
jgi:hypothetical protein